MRQPRLRGTGTSTASTGREARTTYRECDRPHLASADARTLGTDPGAHRRRHDDQLSRSDRTRDCGAVPGERSRAERGNDGRGLLRLLVELRPAPDSRRHLPRSVRHPRHLFHRGRLLVAVHGADGHGAVTQRVDSHAHRSRHLRGAVLPGQQPSPRDLVSTARAGSRERDLFLWSVCRAGVLEHPAVLDHSAPGLARALFRGRQLRRALWSALVVAVPQSGGQHEGEPGGTRLHRGGRWR